MGGLRPPTEPDIDKLFQVMSHQTFSINHDKVFFFFFKNRLISTSFWKTVHVYTRHRHLDFLSCIV